MKRMGWIAGAVIIVLAGVVSAFAGSGNRAGTNGASELLIPVGARDIAMAGATVATTKGVDALFWNPAAVAGIQNSAELYFSHMQYIADIGVSYGAVSANFEGLGVLSLCLKSLSIGDIPVTTTQDPDGTGRTFSPQFLTVGLSYSRQLSQRIAVGITGNLVVERMGDVSASGVAFNVGVVYDDLASVSGLSFGVAVKNIGPQMTFEGSGLLTTANVETYNRPPQLYQVQAASFELPSSIEFGVGYRYAFDGANSFLVSGVFQSSNFCDDEYRVGAEYAFQDFFFLRAGYDFAQKETQEREYLFGPTFGAGVRYSLGGTEIVVDYAYRAVQIFDANHVFAVRLGF
jgi:hypothetical protein